MSRTSVFSFGVIRGENEILRFLCAATKLHIYNSTLEFSGLFLLATCPHQLGDHSRQEKFIILDLLANDATIRRRKSCRHPCFAQLIPLGLFPHKNLNSCNCQKQHNMLTSKQSQQSDRSSVQRAKSNSRRAPRNRTLFKPNTTPNADPKMPAAKRQLQYPLPTKQQHHDQTEPTPSPHPPHPS